MIDGFKLKWHKQSEEPDVWRAEFESAFVKGIYVVLIVSPWEDNEEISEFVIFRRWEEPNDMGEPADVGDSEVEGTMDEIDDAKERAQIIAFAIFGEPLEFWEHVE